MPHHAETDDAPIAANADGTVDHEHPYGAETPTLLIAFGEVTPARLHGCPGCGSTEVSYTASKCYRCGSEFTPAFELPPRTA
ncbi:MULTISPECIES: hypothetical protein [unclassified Amycolatopsis]|uniref:hypothetical protein n=1 Tax=unclassified Amycolatopsis TaxID=2618356 RepID=UPI00106E19F2|nr:MULTISPECIES: hypothetical protein [unclassified Amycolatopsis]